jgi:8-oxo-dGTP diphosphatase
LVQKAIIVDEGGRILVLKRSIHDFRRAGCWDFPGGNYEKGEELLDSLKREIDEETKLKVEKMTPVWTASGQAENDKEVDVIAIIYWAKYADGEVRLSREHSEYRWVTPEEFMKMEVGDDGGLLKNSVRAWERLSRT